MGEGPRRAGRVPADVAGPHHYGYFPADHRKAVEGSQRAGGFGHRWWRRPGEAAGYEVGQVAVHRRTMGYQ